MPFMKYCRTPKFKQLARLADENNYNRIPAPRLLAQLDPQGTHICTFDMVHKHKHGVECEPHMRTIWMVKQRGRKEAVENVSLDIPMKEYQMLPNTESSDTSVVDGTIRMQAGGIDG
jgi:hypothetical protein